MPSLSLRFEKALLDDTLSRNTSMIESWRKERFPAQHTVPTDGYEPNVVRIADGYTIGPLHLE